MLEISEFVSFVEGLHHSELHASRACYGDAHNHIQIVFSDGTVRPTTRIRLPIRQSAVRSPGPITLAITKAGFDYLRTKLTKHAITVADSVAQRPWFREKIYRYICTRTVV
jgi:hypothetical protein